MAGTFRGFAFLLEVLEVEHNRVDSLEAELGHSAGVDLRTARSLVAGPKVLQVLRLVRLEPQ
jgi:hypothetical protein